MRDPEKPTQGYIFGQYLPISKNTFSGNLSYKPACHMVYTRCKACIFSICKLERKFLLKRDTITTEQQPLLPCRSVFITGVLYITL